MKFSELTNEQKLAYQAAWRTVLRNMDSAMGSMRHFLVGIVQTFPDDTKLCSAAYRLDMCLWEMMTAPDVMTELLGMDRNLNVSDGG